MANQRVSNRPLDPPQDPPQILATLFQQGLSAVNGRRRVAAAVVGLATGDLDLVAVGKAACAMAQGAFTVRRADIRRALVITRHGYATPLDPDPATDCRLLTAAHPLPDESSLHAGAELRAFLAQGSRQRTLLFLLSGGASALVEAVADPVSAADLTQANRWLLASGLPIQAVNEVRRAMSLLKGGRLVPDLRYHSVEYWLLSDVPDNAPATIGSGLLAAAAPTSLPPGLPERIRRIIALTPPPPAGDHPGFGRIRTRLLASNRTALDAIYHAALSRGMAPTLHRKPLTGDAESAALHIATQLRKSPAGLHLWGGETTVVLPSQPGRGGRCQHLALAAARALDRGPSAWLLVAGTDGSDGNSDQAGAWVNHQSAARASRAGFDAAAALRSADSGAVLEHLGQTLFTGPTGTNVMDIVLGYRAERSP